ncbi:MAG: hypothetical protein HY959_03840 [Ignavibacteriae bacterium]|nr:hypothetical protein [Ignavibacteriota bacterium]
MKKYKFSKSIRKKWADKDLKLRKDLRTEEEDPEAERQLQEWKDNRGH